MDAVRRRIVSGAGLLALAGPAIFAPPSLKAQTSAGNNAYPDDSHLNMSKSGRVTYTLSGSVGDRQISRQGLFSKSSYDIAQGIEPRVCQEWEIRPIISRAQHIEAMEAVYVENYSVDSLLPGKTLKGWIATNSDAFFLTKGRNCDGYSEDAKLSSTIIISREYRRHAAESSVVLYCGSYGANYEGINGEHVLTVAEASSGTVLLTRPLEGKDRFFFMELLSSFPDQLTDGQAVYVNIRSNYSLAQTRVGTVPAAASDRVFIGFLRPTA